MPAAGVLQHLLLLARINSQRHIQGVVLPKLLRGEGYTSWS
jgi:hypothetical protein